MIFGALYIVILGSLAIAVGVRGASTTGQWIAFFFLVLVVVYLPLSLIRKWLEYLHRPPLKLYAKGLDFSYRTKESGPLKTAFIPYSRLTGLNVYECPSSNCERAKLMRSKFKEKQRLGFQSTIIQDRFFPRKHSCYVPLDYPNRTLFDCRYRYIKGQEIPVEYKVNNELVKELNLDPNEEISFDDERIEQLGDPYFEIINRDDAIHDYQAVKSILLEKAQELGFPVSYKYEECPEFKKFKTNNDKKEGGAVEE